MVRIIAYIRPHKLEEVKSALADRGVTGITVTEVRGTGASPEPAEFFLGSEYVVALPPRLKLEAVVTDSLQEPAISAIIQSARTGRDGDGKIFVQKVLDSVRVRTGESGEAAL